MNNLANVKLGKNYVIEGISTSSTKNKRRLLELGFTIGQKIKPVRKSLVGKVFLIEIRGYTLSIKRTVAEAVIVK